MMLDKKLLEGIKFGAKEMQAVKANSDAFRVGIEYEFTPLEKGQGLLKDKLEGKDLEEILHVFFNENMFTEFSNLYDEFIIEGNLESLRFMEQTYENCDVWMGLIRTVCALAISIKYHENEYDGKTQDMLSDEKADAYIKLFSDIAEKYDFQFVDTDFNYIDKKTFFELCYLFDVHEGAETFKGDEGLIEEFWQALRHFSEAGDELTYVHDENRRSKILNLVQFFKNSNLDKIAKTTEHPYGYEGFDGFSSDSDSLHYYQVIDYENKYSKLSFFTSECISYIIENSGDLVIENPTRHIEGVLSEYGIKSGVIQDIVTEHDDMVEVITTELTVMEALDNIERMFEFLMDNAKVYEYAGMHISISTVKHDHDAFDMIKFVTLLDLPHILKYFPERGYVNNLYDIVKNILKNKLSVIFIDCIEYGATMSDIVNEGIEYAKLKINKEKHQSINFSDYRVLNGRIELRFFGGEDYHQRKDDIVTQMLRALYLLTFAYTDEHNDTYKRKLAKMVNEVFKENLGMSFSHVYKGLYELNKCDPNLGLTKILYETDKIDNAETKRKVEKVIRQYFKNESTLRAVRQFFK